MPNISVIVPIYNAEKTLSRCVDSILAQTYPDFELLLVVDGSPDRSGEICDDYAKKDPRVRALHQENAGAAAARNLGMREAKGNYFAFADSDDAMVPDSLEVLLRTIKTFGGDIAMCNYSPTKNGVEDPPVLHGFAEGTHLDANGIRQTLYANIRDGKTNGYFSLWNKLIRAELVRERQLSLNPNMSFGEDLCFVLDLLANASGISFTERALYLYEQSESGLFTRYRPSRLDNALACYQKLLSVVFSSDEARKAPVRLHCRYFDYVNRHLAATCEDGRHELAELYRTLEHPTVKFLFSIIAGMDEETRNAFSISDYEQKLPRLVASGKKLYARTFARYLYDGSCLLRRAKSILESKQAKT